MAVYLKYRLLELGDLAVDYEIHTSPTDPDPVRVRIPIEPEPVPPAISGERIAANKAIRQILQRRMTEGAWPKAGMIQS